MVLDAQIVSEDTCLFKEYENQHIDGAILKMHKNYAKPIDTSYIYRGVIRGTDVDHITFIYIYRDGYARCTIFRKDKAPEVRSGNLIVPKIITDLALIIDIAKSLTYDITDTELRYVAPDTLCDMNYDIVKSIHVINKDKITLTNLHNSAVEFAVNLVPGVFTSIVHRIYQFTVSHTKSQLDNIHAEFSATIAQLTSENIDIKAQLVEANGEHENIRLRCMLDCTEINAQLENANTEIERLRAELAAEKQKWAASSEKLSAALNLLKVDNE